MGMINQKVKSYGEPATVIDDSHTQYLIQYEDDVKEWVNKDAIEFVKVYKSRLSASKSMKRTSIPKVNVKRRKSQYARNFGNVERVIAINSMSCAVVQCYNTDIVNAHMKSRGAGGTYLDIIPLCNPHHREQHDYGTTAFINKYGINVSNEIKRIRTELGEI